MQANANRLTLVMSEKTGSILKISGPDVDFSQEPEIGLFCLRLVDREGRFHLVDALDAGQVVAARTNQEEGTVLRIAFSDFPRYPGLAVTATANLSACIDRIEWGLYIQNDTDYAIEYIDYPRFLSPDNLGPGSGQHRVFWPYTEGCLIEDTVYPRFREHPLTYPSGGEPVYPGLVTMQFMAYYGPRCGLYFAAHDARSIPKAIECIREDPGIRLTFKAFCCIGSHCCYTLPYPMVMELFEGDWMDAAELYRRFVEQSEFPLPSRMFGREHLPAWQKESPVVVIFPPRSIRGTGYMGRNEFYPYTNAEKYLADLSESIDSNLLALLTYWEGSAPWCPPYIWPPYGGEEGFLAFVNSLHARGDYIGVYGSGLHWTDRSLLCPEFDKSREREELGLTECMCAGPDGSLSSKICQTIRTGFEMCPACEPTVDIALTQLTSILDAGVDFVQYFDQNMGGRGYVCYSKKHGHPPLYGSWSVEAMVRIYERMIEIIAKKGNHSALGCESSPADCFIKYLTFNDLRYNMVFAFGKPVPAFEYVFHEYNINFMGNQCAFTQHIPVNRNPDTLLFRMAYSLVAGDLLTVVMKSGGELHWEWGMSWLEPGPRQLPLIKAIRNYAAMRRYSGYPYLHYGRMLRPAQVECGENYEMIRTDGSAITFDGILTSKWRAPDGSEAQFLANFREWDMNVVVNACCILAFDAWGKPLEFTCTEDKTAIQVPALSCIGLLMKESG